MPELQLLLVLSVELPADRSEELSVELTRALLEVLPEHSRAVPTLVELAMVWLLAMLELPDSVDHLASDRQAVPALDRRPDRARSSVALPLVEPPSVPSLPLLVVEVPVEPPYPAVEPTPLSLEVPRPDRSSEFRG